jgi:hypothetical protein
VFESGESQVYDIDSMLTNYYDDSDSDSDSEAKNGDSDDNESDTISISDDEGDEGDEVEGEGEGEGEGDEGYAHPDVNAVHDDPEFEMIEEPSTK